MSATFINVEPFTVDDFEHNAVRVNITYDKNKKGPVASFTACKVDPENEGVTWYKTMIFTSPSAHVQLDTWKMYSAKKLSALSQQIFQQLSEKSGAMWDKLTEMLGKHNSKPV